MSDRHDLERLVARYAHCVDRRDYIGLAALFAPESRVGKFENGEDGEGFWRIGGEPFASSVRSNHAGHRATSHFLGQHTSDIDGTTATGETYCMAYHLYVHDDQWRNRVASIRYLDDFVCSDAMWLFATRRIIVDWTAHLPMGAQPTSEGWRPI